MPDPSLTCLRCQGDMELGFVIDKTHYSAPEMQTWAEGNAERSFWGGLKMKGRAVMPVITYRCERCGYLESYAIE